MKTNIRQVIIWFILFHVYSITVTYILYYGYGYWVDETICITSMLSAAGIMAIYYILKDTTRQFFHYTNQRRDLKKWIPCSERLPENKDDVLVCWGENNVSVGYFVSGGAGGWFFEQLAGGRKIPYEPFAWQPLPEAYKLKGEREG